ncbi:helix-turn-helix domain-containing protein [Streptomyces sp. NPDC048663]|uniref:helix-turn-helix domain-containing protein n=1 Tax=Streptomyces sp. NPDC048663 TaxID=3155638 RepID=UPI003426AA7D
MLLTDKGKPDTTARYVLWALAEHAHADGSNSYPSLLTIEYRTGLNETTIRRALRRLEDGKLITADGVTERGCTRWRLSMGIVRPESDQQALAERERERREQTASRVRKHRARASGDSAVTDSKPVTEMDAVTGAESVRNGPEVRYVTGAESVRNGRSAPRTSSEPVPEPVGNSSSSAEPPNEPQQAEPETPEVLDGELVDETDAPVTAQTITGEWLERCNKRPPSRVIGQVAKQIKTLLEENIEPDDIRRGLAAWMAKGYAPGAIPTFVNEAMNASPPARTAPAAAAGVGYDPQTGMTVFDRARARIAARTAARQQTGPNGYDPSTGMDLFDRAMERAKARDAANEDGGQPASSQEPA